MVFIITQYGEDVSKAIISELKRGATILSGKGAYTSADRNMIVCAVRKNEFYKVKRIVNMVDPTAFMMVTDAGEVLGEGFKPIKEQK
ncbi:MAG: hypothetical protein K0R90_1727, partial [Oscillospiraceae bacterium]|nr:hypothetical protein [Oscillospiraceae bacterium]